MRQRREAVELSPRLFQAGGECGFCPQGTFRTKGVHKVCTPCQPGLTTEGTGAVSAAECDTPRSVAVRKLVFLTFQ